MKTKNKIKSKIESFNNKKANTKKSTKVLSLCLKVSIIVCILFFFNVSILVAEDNVIGQSWTNEIMQRWEDYGVINGVSDGNLAPNDFLTKVEAITILNRINNPQMEVNIDDSKYKDVETFRWYYSEIDKAVATGILTGTPDGEIKPKELITREVAFVMIAKLFDITYKGSDADKYLDDIYEDNGRHMISEFGDGCDAGIWASPYIAGLLELGYIEGYKDNTLKPNEYITRGEFIKILDNIVGTLVSEEGIYDLEKVLGNIVVNVPGVIIDKVSPDATIYMMAGSNEDIIIEDEEVPTSLSVGTIKDDIDYSAYAASNDDIKRKKLIEMKVLYNMPTAEDLPNTTAHRYYNQVKGTDKWNELIYKVSEEEEIDPIFVKCIMTIESNGRAGVISKTNSNGTRDYGLMQINSTWASSFDLQRILNDNEYAIRCGIKVIKRKIEAAERGKKAATVFEVAWRYNGYNSKGKQYAEKLSGIYEDLSGLSRDSLVRVSASN